MNRPFFREGPWPYGYQAPRATPRRRVPYAVPAVPERRRIPITRTPSRPSNEPASVPQRPSPTAKQLTDERRCSSSAVETTGAARHKVVSKHAPPPAAAVADTTAVAPGAAAAHAQAEATATAHINSARDSSTAPDTTDTNAPRTVQSAVLSDLDAARARFEREAKRSSEQSRRNVLRDMLQVYDDVERAIGAARDADQASGPLWQGMCLVRDGFLDKLSKHGASPVDSDACAFDPAVHEAIAVETAPAEDAGKVLRTLQRGFRVGDELLRPATVVVGKAA